MSSILSGFCPISRASAGGDWRRWGACRARSIFYESPYRIVKLLEELVDLYPERRVVLARELTKKFEELRAGSARQLLEEMQRRPIKGEFVVLLAAKGL